MPDLWKCVAVEGGLGGGRQRVSFMLFGNFFLLDRGLRQIPSQGEPKPPVWYKADFKDITAHSACTLYYSP